MRFLRINATNAMTTTMITEAAPTYRTVLGASVGGGGFVGEADGVGVMVRVGVGDGVGVTIVGLGVAGAGPTAR